jgi:hypothetical protein
LLRCSSVFSRGEQPPRAPISLFITLVFTRLLAGVDLRRHWATPLRSAPSGAPRQRCAHSRVRNVALNAPESFPKSLEPCRGRSPRLRRDLAARSSGAAALKTGRPNHAGRWISDIQPRSGGQELIRTDLTSTVRCKSIRPDPLPSPALCAGPGPLDLPPVAGTPSPPVSARRASARARLRNLISAVDLRSNGSAGPIPIHM